MKKIYILLNILLFLVNFSFAQEINKDSIANELKENEKIILENITQNPTQALELCAMGKFMAMSIEDSLWIAKMDMYCGRCHFQNRIYYMAMDNQYKALEIFSKLKNYPLICTAYIDIAKTYYRQEIYEMAEEYCLRAFDLSKEKNLDMERAMALKTLGQIRINQDIEDAIESMLTAKRIFEENADTANIIDININLSRAFKRNDEYDEALSLLEKNAELYIKPNDLYSLARNYTAFGRVYHNSDYNKTADCYDKALKLFTQMELPAEISEVELYWSKLCIDNNHIDQALSKAKHCLEINDRAENMRMKNYALKNICEALRKKGDKGQLFFYLERLTSVQDSILIEKRKEQFSEFQYNLENQKQQKEIETLQANREKERKELEHKNTVYTATFGAIIFVLLISFIVYIYRNLKEKTTKNQLLQKANEQLELEVQERKLTETDLKNAEEKYKLIFQKTPIGIVQFNDLKNISAVNDRFLDIFHIEDQNIIGKNLDKFFSTEVLDQFSFNDFNANASSQVINTMANTIQGVIYLSITFKPYFYNTGRDIEKGGLMIIQDDTKRKYAENMSRIANSENNILSQLPDEFYLLNNEGIYIDVRVAHNADRIKEYLHKDMRDVLSGEIKANFLIAFKNALKFKEIQYVEIEEDNQKFQQARFIPDSNGNVLIIINDISNLKVKELNLKNAKVTAESGLKAKSQFILESSNDIKKSLEELKDKTQFLKEKLKDSENLEKLQEIEHSITNIVEYQTDILNFAKVETNNNQKLLKTINPVTIAKDIFDIFYAKAIEKNIEYTFEEAPGLSQNLKLDEVRIHQVLFKLVSNAIKFTEKGDITLNVGYEELPNDKINLIYTITDSGCGLSQIEQEHLFDKDGKKTMYPTKQLCEMMNGEISVESELGLGSTFSVIIKNIEAHISHNSSEIDDALLHQKRRSQLAKEFAKAVRENISQDYKEMKKQPSFVSLMDFANKYQALAQKFAIAHGEKLVEKLLSDIKNYDISGINHSLEEIENFSKDLSE